MNQPAVPSPRIKSEQQAMQTIKAPSTARRNGQCRYAEMVDYLHGRPAPALPAVPGRVIRAHDEPLPDDLLPFITTPGELALILGISRHAAKQRITQRAEMAQSHERHEP